jgi:hypothetical protein
MSLRGSGNHARVPNAPPLLYLYLFTTHLFSLAVASNVAVQAMALLNQLQGMQDKYKARIDHLDEEMKAIKKLMMEEKKKKKPDKRVLMRCVARGASTTAVLRWTIVGIASETVGCGVGQCPLPHAT